MWIVDVINGPVSIAAAVVPVTVYSLHSFSSRRARKRLLGFRGGEIDIVLTSSAMGDDVTAGGVSRPTTGSGSVTALGIIAQALGHHYKRAEIVTHLSEQISRKLSHDLISVGGPRRNLVTRLLFEQLVSSSGEALVQLDDEAMCLSVGDYVVDRFDLRVEKGFPHRDLALVIMAENPFSYDAARAVICCGFTSYGTAAAATFLFGEVLPRRAQLRPSVRRSAWRYDRVRPGVVEVAVVELSLKDGRVVGERVAYTASLPVKPVGATSTVRVTSKN